jgi:hypothetical protein
MTAIAWLGVAGCVAFTLLVDACLDPDRRAAMRAVWEPGARARGGHRPIASTRPLAPLPGPTAIPKRPYISPPATPTDYSDLRALIARSLPDPPSATEPRARRD